jgi:hypothetical protein
MCMGIVVPDMHVECMIQLRICSERFRATFST